MVKFLAHRAHAPTLTGTQPTTVDDRQRHRSTCRVILVITDGEPTAHLLRDGRACRNGGRVFAPTPGRLGEFVVRDYLRVRRGTR
jgi:uncharacterized protein with von Willebrand factor type A (vWA) domain